MTIKYGEKLQIMQSYYRMGNRIIVIFTYLLCEKHKNNCYNGAALKLIYPQK